MESKDLVKNESHLPKKKADLLERIKQVHPDHDLQLTEEGAALLEKFFRLENLVDQSCIMTCPGAEDCVWAQAGECPLAQAGATLPIGKICPIESLRFADSWQDLVQGVEDADPHHFCSHLEKSLCKKIAGFDIEIARIQKEISRRPAAVINVQIPTREGIIEGEDENPAYKTLKNLEGMRISTLRQLNKAMENRHRTVKSRAVDSDEQKRREKMQAFMEKNPDQVVDAEFEVKKEKEEADIFDRHKKASQENKKKVEEKVEKMKQLREMSDE